MNPEDVNFKPKDGMVTADGYTLAVSSCGVCAGRPPWESPWEPLPHPQLTAKDPSTLGHMIVQLREAWAACADPATVRIYPPLKSRGKDKGRWEVIAVNRKGVVIGTSRGDDEGEALLASLREAKAFQSQRAGAP